MARKLDAKCARCRRAGAKLFLKGERCNTAKCAIVKRNYPPGIHGVKGRGKSTGYGEQLTEKQKAKRIYGILEKQFSKYYVMATNTKGDANLELLRLLEMRLDSVVYRLGFAASRTQARQLVLHGHFVVNGKKVNIPSFQVKVGDKISVSTKAQKSKIFANLSEKLGKANIPSWLALEGKNLEGKVLNKPAREEIDTSFDIKAIIEFYSR
ncbi:MAG: 30S ribosomal protein S4 [Patescibacteria group bacterium]|jgi:small subunit ribosomal protein S4